MFCPPLLRKFDQNITSFSKQNWWTPGNLYQLMVPWHVMVLLITLLLLIPAFSWSQSVINQATASKFGVRVACFPIKTFIFLSDKTQVSAELWCFCWMFPPKGSIGLGLKDLPRTVCSAQTTTGALGQEHGNVLQDRCIKDICSQKDGLEFWLQTNPVPVS